MTFEDAIAYTENLLSRQDLDDSQLESEIANLVQTANGARGFFVCFLTLYTKANYQIQKQVNL